MADDQGDNLRKVVHFNRITLEGTPIERIKSSSKDHCSCCNSPKGQPSLYVISETPLGVAARSNSDPLPGTLKDRTPICYCYHCFTCAKNFRFDNLMRCHFCDGILIPLLDIGKFTRCKLCGKTGRKKDMIFDENKKRFTCKPKCKILW